jgi:hypothetical protein
MVIVHMCEQIGPTMVVRRPAPHDTGNNNRNAPLRDPDGNLVEIVAKPS